MPMPLIAGNWKMNGSLSLVETFGQALADADLPSRLEVALMVPFPYLESASRALAALARYWGRRRSMTSLPGPSPER